MTESQRRQVIQILNMKIEADGLGFMKLNQVPQTLQAADIDRSVYAGAGLKRWLIEYFPEFIVDGSNGLETVWPAQNTQALYLKRIAEALQHCIQTEGPPLFSNIPQYIKEQCGVDYREYAAGKGLQQWLLATFPQFDKSQDGLSLILKQEPADDTRQSAQSAETRQMYSLAFMNWWGVNSRQLRQYNTFEGLDENAFRDIVAHQLAAALLGRKGLLSALGDAQPRLAFPIGLHASDGSMIYCVLGVNPRGDDNAKKPFILEGFCCPGDPSNDGLGQWLANRFTLNDRHAAPDYSHLRGQVREIWTAREALLTLAGQYMAALSDGRAPEVLLGEKVSLYERLWAELQTSVQAFPALAARKPLRLCELEEQIDEKAQLADQIDRAAASFDEVIAGVCRLYEINHLGDPEEGTPGRDRRRLHDAVDAVRGKADLAVLQELLHAYRALRSVMTAQRYQDVEDDVETVTAHFGEISYNFAVKILIASDEADVGALAKLGQIDKAVGQCAALAAAAADGQSEQPADADGLLRQALDGGEDWAFRLIGCLGALLPPDGETQALVLGDQDALRLSPDAGRKLDGVSMELTPYGAGCRLLAAQGNRDRLAEKYFLLGLRYDEERCAPALLRIYREENRRENFEAVWRRYGSAIVCSDEDRVYWLVLRCPDADGNGLDQLEELLTRRPALLHNERIRMYVRSVAPQLGCRPKAFWAWLGHFAAPFNAFETAVETNDLERIYAQLDDENTMRGLGYSAEDTAEIRAALQQRLPVGMDNCSKAMRLLAVQKNRNHAAESLLWAAAPSAKAALALFDIYREQADYASVCWIAGHFGMEFEEGGERTDAYLESLVKSHSAAQLETFARRHPALWYREGVLAELSAGQAGLVQNRQYWTDLLEWHQSHPFAAPCPFETALVSGDFAELQRSLADAAQMTAWGYSEEAQAQARGALERAAAHWGQEEKEIFGRIEAFQGNLHRFLEGYLYQILPSDRAWGYQQMFRLMFAEARYAVAAACYEAYPVLQTGERNTTDYLWCLAHLERYEQLLERAEANPRCLKWDAGLTKAILKIADRYGKPEYAKKIRQTVNLQPANRFEESLINLDAAKLRQMISDPSQLLELGYTREEINHFKDCFSKPYAGGNDGFSIGSRMRSFLGDERAEQFLLDSEQDPRSARQLFDMYSKARRWDDLCSLYQRHADQGVWNDHYRKNYGVALSKAERAENCRKFIEFIDSTPQIDKNNPEVQWLYLRALLGTGRAVKDAERATLIPTGAIPFKRQIVSSIFDLLWHGAGNNKENAVRLADDLVTLYKTQLSPETLRFLVSVNGHLTEEPDRQSWAEFLRGNGLDDFLWLLNCCFGFETADDPEKSAQFAQALKARLDAAAEKLTQQELTVYSSCIADLTIPEEAKRGLSDSLLSAWARLLTPESAAFDEGAWDAFTARIGDAAASAQGYLRVLNLWSEAFDRAAGPEIKRRALLYGVRLFMKAPSPKDAAAEERMLQDAAAELSRKLAGAWAEVFESGGEIGEQEWEAFAGFWAAAPLSDEQVAGMDAAWASRLRTEERPDSRFFARAAAVMGTAGSRRQYVPSFMDALVDAFIEWLQSDEASDAPEGLAAAVSFVKNSPLRADQVDRLLEKLPASELFADDTFRDAVQYCCEKQGTAMAYRWKKLECLHLDGDENKHSELLQQLLELSSGLSAGAFDKTDLQMLYEAVCRNLSAENIRLLCSAYSQAGAADQAQILSALQEGDWQAGRPQALLDWFLRMLDRADLEWVKRYSRWWAPLVRLSGEDQQTKVMVDFLGLTDDSVGEFYQQSVTRLLLSDMDNLNYLKCFLRIVPGLSSVARSKLEYMEAENDPEQIEAVARQAIDRGQYDLAAALLLRKMDLPISNSSSVGQLIGALYTAETLEASPGLRDKIPAVFAGIRKMNASDPQGKWKNIGRAVDIACVGGCGNAFFESLGADVLADYPGKYAAVVADMLVRAEFKDAKRWNDQARAQSNHPYLTLLDFVLEECLRTGELSHRNELLVRSIPRDGNQRPLDFFGQLADFAFKRGWQKDCADAFALLYEMNPADAGLTASCIQLYMADEGLGMDFLYQAAQNYLNIAPDSFVLRAAKSLAVVCSCLPDGEERSGEMITACMRRISAANREWLSDIVALEKQCREFLASQGDTALKREVLLRAATGWWKMNHAVLALVGPWKELLKKLSVIYPVSCAAACLCSALLYQADADYQGGLEALLLDCGQEANVSLAAKRMRYVKNILPSRIPTLENLLDRPMEMPGLYPCLFDTVLQNGDEEQARDETFLILAVQVNFGYINYQTNMLRLKQKIDAEYPAQKGLIPQLLAQMGIDEVTPDTLQIPAVYLAAGDYSLMLRAAQHQLEQIAQSPRPSRFKQVLEESYEKLGLLMTGQLSNEEKAQLHLYEIVNMANLLCQSDAYKDLHVLRDLCKAKWKICIRCIQELIQGQPNNILFVLRQKAFLEHAGCAGIVAKMAYQFATSTMERSGQNLLQAENRQNGRRPDWGVIRSEEVPRLSAPKVVLLHVNRRHPVRLRPFREEIEELLREMRHEDQFEDNGTESGLDIDKPAEISQAYRSFKKIPYVVEQVDRWLANTPGDAEEAARRREALTARLSGTRANAERIDLYGQLIALDWASDGSTTLCWYCVEMGLWLFEEACEKKGIALYATPKARRILYDMAACLPGIKSGGSIAGRIRTDLKLCLASYEDLSELIGDCSQPYMLALCRAITDKEVQAKMEQHILFVREIGNMMSSSMTNTERLDWLKDCVARCQAGRNNFNAELAQQLILLLNRQIVSLEGMAQVVLTVYNDTGTMGEGYLFGKIENLGTRGVSSVQMELSLDGVVYQRYLLEQLEGRGMVPFDLAYATDDDRETLHYGLTARFITDDGQEEQSTPVEGTLRLQDPEELDFEYEEYMVTIPATRENYTERTNIQKILNALYGDKKSFENFPNLAIYGMRRTGKSSVLRRLERMLAEREDPVYYVESSGEGVDGDDMERVHSILVKKVLARLSPQLQSRPGWEEFRKRWDEPPAETVPPRWDWLDEFYTALTQEWLSTGLVVLVDEVEKLYLAGGEQVLPPEQRDDVPDEETALYMPDSAAEATVQTGTSGLWNTLSRVTQDQGSMVRFVLCGSDFFINQIIEGDNLTQFFQRIKKLSIGRMDHNELVQTMHSIDRDGGNPQLHPDAVEYLWSIAGGLPWHSKLIGNTIIENRLIHEEGAKRAVIYPSDIAWGVDCILNNVQASSDNNYGLVALYADEQIILDVLNEELKTPSAKVGDALLRQRFHAVVGDESWENRYDRAMKTLVSERQILTRSRANREEQYQFGCELYRLYNRREKLEQFVARR